MPEQSVIRARRQFCAMLAIATVASCAVPKHDAKSLLANDADALTQRQIAISDAVRDPRTPAPAVIDRLEKVLAHERCVNGINRWSRRYAFGLGERDIISTDRMQFALRSPAATPTLQVVSYGAFPELDDGKYERIDGDYQPSTGRIRISYCGPNRP